MGECHVGPENRWQSRFVIQFERVEMHFARLDVDLQPNYLACKRSILHLNFNVITFGLLFAYLNVT
jgi:hypothetical protein